MKFELFFIIGIVIIAICNAQELLSKKQEDEIVDNYLTKFNIRIGRTSDGEEIRKNILKKYKEVEEHNADKSKTYELELNEYSYLSDEEFAATRLGVVPAEDQGNGNGILWTDDEDKKRNGRAAVPDSWDWTTKGSVVQPVQNQGSCGSCYAFAAIAAIEGSMCRYYGVCQKLSEQEAMECTTGCNGGWDETVYNYAMVKGGCASSSYYYTPYTRSGCNTGARGRVSRSKVKQWYVLPNNAETIKNFVYNYGPVSSSFYVYSNFNSYKNGIITSCPGSVLGGHAVLIVGYGVENGIKYWKVKNSWGTGWGQGGYFKIERGVDRCRFEGWKVSYPWTQ